jgi:hypothetical protein
MKFTWTPLAIIRTRKDTGGYGLARGPYVTLPADSTPHQLPHELIHVKQWWDLTVACAAALYVLQLYITALPLGVVALSIGVHGAFYALSKKYRFWAEAQAYRVSVETSPERFEDFAKMLQNYDTGKTLDQCRAALKK